jgi:hypothetical protein
VIDLEEAQQILKGHVRWVESKRDFWKRHRNLYGDRFWTGSDRSASQRVWVTTSTPVAGGDDASPRPSEEVKIQGVTIEVNLLRPLVTSFVAPLGYQGIHFNIAADLVDPVEEDAETRDGVEAGIRAISGRWFESEEVVDTTERAFAMGLLYEGGVAYRVGLADEEHVPSGTHILDRLYLEALPPWEAVWDRRARSARTQRYVGHLRTVPKEALEGIEEEDLTSLPDVVSDGTRRTPDPREVLDKSYAWVFELWDLTEPDGRYAIYKVISDGASDGLGLEPKIEALKASGPVPDSRPDGGPVVPIVPFIAEPNLEYPLDSLSAVSSPANLNAELNRALSVIGEAFRRDAARVLMFLKDKVSASDMQAIANAPDLAFVGIDAETLDGLMKFLEKDPISPTILTYIEQIFSGIDRTQLTADMTRGKAGQYLSATEAGALAEYSATMVGRIRRRMDTVHVNVAQTALHLLRSELGGPIKVRVDDTTVSLGKEELGRRWVISVIDSASTPAEKAKHLADFNLVMPHFEKLAGYLADPQLAGTAVQRYAAGAWVELTENLRVGDGLQLESIIPDGLPEPEPEPAPEEAPSPEAPPEAMPPEAGMGQEMISPEEQQMLMNTPEAQAIAAGVPVG